MVVGGVAFSPMKDWTVEAIAAAGWPAGGIRDKFGRLCVAYVAIKSNLELAADTHTKLIQISAKLVKDKAIIRPAAHKTNLAWAVAVATNVQN